MTDIMNTRIADLLLSYDGEGDTPTKRQLNVRVSIDTFAKLAVLAGHYNGSRSALAADLLEAAVDDALHITTITLQSSQSVVELEYELQHTLSSLRGEV